MITILFVDHSVENERSLRQLLAGRRANNFKLDRVVSYREVLNGFRSKAYDVCLIDSGFDNGLKLLARARGVGFTAPIVLVTANNAGEVLEAIRSGVADCLVRDELDASSIERAICSVVEQARGVSLQIKRERRYLALIDNADEIISTHDLEGNFTSINRTGEQLIGYSQEEILARNFSEIVAPEYRDLLKKMIEQTLDAQKFTYREIDLLTKSGQRLRVEVSTHLIYHQGNPIEVHLVARDLLTRGWSETLSRHTAASQFYSDEFPVSFAPANDRHVLVI